MEQTVEINKHIVKYWWKNYDGPTPVKELDEADIESIKEEIAEGYLSGSLYIFHFIRENEVVAPEIIGYWSVKHYHRE